MRSFPRAETLLEQLSALPLLWLACAFLGGVVFSDLLPLAAWLWFAAGGILALGALLVRWLRPQAALALLLLPAVFVLGAARHAWGVRALETQTVAAYNDLDRNLYVTGTLADAPDVRDTYINLRLKVKAVDAGDGDIPATGFVLVRLTNDYDLAYGDAVRVRGRLETPPEDETFSYRAYLLRQGVVSILHTDKITLLPFGAERHPFWAFLYRLRGSLYREVNALFPQPEASLMNGILLGIESDIPEDVQQAFKDTGTAHIVAISGFNIAIIAGLFFWLFNRWFGKTWGALLAILGIAFYTLLVGASASVVRAAIMGALALLARQFGRRSLALNTLFATAVLMALWNPFTLWDVGFQLSFMATLGLVLYAQPWQDAARAFLLRFLPRDTVDAVLGPFSEYFLLTFAAQLTTLPVTVYHFGRLSLISFVVNPFVLPAQPPIMIFGGLAAIAGKLHHPLGQILAWFTFPFPAYSIRTIEYFAGFESGVLTVGEFGFLTMFLLYALLFGLTVFWPYLAAFRSLVSVSLLTVILGIVTVNLWRTAANGPDGRLHVTLLDVGSAEAILLKTPDGRFLLINGGPSPARLVNQIGRQIPPFRRKLDALIVAAPQENQVAALPRILDQYPPDTVFWMGNRQASYSARRLEEWLAEHAIPITEPGPGDVLDLGQGAVLRVLAVSPRGGVLMVEWNNFKVVLPLGVRYDTFEQLRNGDGLGPVTAIVLAESGYNPSNPAAWLRNLQPEMILLSVAAGDFDGRPSPDLLETLKGANLLRTDWMGWVELVTDGQDVWVGVERK
ncbi:MAG: ComEC/Rec2 family competence protein [Anaerolineales bacterium]|nr:ComEC/Rec2 family competence protein [Anaerolineales bacterium]MDW8277141.1 ComEC/Rec2 family competence protein [Anaerolineales bacterium]